MFASTIWLPVSASWGAVIPFTVAAVPTGMKRGVSTTPWGVWKRPQRARVHRQRSVIAKENGVSMAPWWCCADATCRPPARRPKARRPKARRGSAGWPIWPAPGSSTRCCPPGPPCSPASRGSPASPPGSACCSGPRRPSSGSPWRGGPRCSPRPPWWWCWAAGSPAASTPMAPWTPPMAWRRGTLPRGHGRQPGGGQRRAGPGPTAAAAPGGAGLAGGGRAGGRGRRPGVGGVLGPGGAADRHGPLPLPQRPRHGRVSTARGPGAWPASCVPPPCCW